MSFRVVLNAEGGGERGIAGLGLGALLGEHELGSGHDLLRRCLAETGALPEGAILFVRPLRLGSREARGSDLLARASAHRLLAWPPGSRPDLAVFLVDGDGDLSRRETVESATAGALEVPVIGVAVHEFESWLVADEAAVGRALGIAFPRQQDPEQMQPREAKAILADAIGRSNSNRRQARRTIARTCDLDVVSRRCPAFHRFRAELLARVRAATRR